MVTRFYNDTLEQLVATIETLRFYLNRSGFVNGDAGTLTGKDAYELVVGRRWHNISYNSDIDDSGIPKDLGGLSDYLSNRIGETANALRSSTGNGGNYKDLIETITTICQLPYADSHISRKAFAALRKAILMPEEILTFQAETAKQELHCYRCLKPFGHGESATLIKNGDGFSVSCQRCNAPSITRCSCGKLKPIADATKRRNRKEAQCVCDIPTDVVPSAVPLPDDSI